jgi:hypothetical protein
MVEIPDDMDVPLMRRDTSKMENVRWLLRNLAIRNSNNPKFSSVIKELQKHGAGAFVLDLEG